MDIWRCNSGWEKCINFFKKKPRYNHTHTHSKKRQARCRTSSLPVSGFYAFNGGTQWREWTNDGRHSRWHCPLWCVWWSPALDRRWLSWSLQAPPISGWFALPDAHEHEPHSLGPRENPKNCYNIIWYTYSYKDIRIRGLERLFYLTCIYKFEKLHRSITAVFF